MVVARKEYFGKLLEPGLRKVFYETYDQMPSMIGELYNMQTTNNAYEEDLNIGTMGEFPRFEGTVQYDRIYQGYSSVYTFPEFASGFMVERMLYDDGKYNVIQKRPAALAISAQRRREADAAEIFNKAFEQVGFDGKPLCATDHPSPAPDGPSARCNMTTYKLSHESLQYVKNQMRKTVDDRGGKISVVPDTLLVPVSLEETAWELIQSDRLVNTNYNNPNIHQGRYKLIVWDFLDDDGQWFLIDSRYAKMFLNWFDRVPLEFAMEEDFDTLVAKYRAYMRYNAGWSDWIWIYGSTGEDNYPLL